ncbi:MAG TPA: PepSY domain-containing protein [Pirellulaceae bacterium]|jgi:hypothetical protein|nr:PepSY domain-containing protein [Pirellulaceae bacterium]
MRRTIMTGGGAAVLALAMWAAPLSAADQPKAEIKLPPAVTKTLEARFPGAKIDDVEQEKKEGKVCYELELSIDSANEGEEEEFEVLISAEGQILEIANQIDPKELPMPVQQAVKKAHPNAKIVKSESVRIGETGQAYEVEVKTEKGELELRISADGKIVSSEQGDEESEKKQDDDDRDDDDIQPKKD